MIKIAKVGIKNIYIAPTQEIETSVVETGSANAVIREMWNKLNEVERIVVNKMISKLNNYDERLDKAIEYIENCSGIYKNALNENKEMISSKNVLYILKGDDKE